MDRRKFLKIIGTASLAAVISPALFAKNNIKKVINAVRKGKYPGRIKAFNENIIRKEGKWLG